MSASHIKLYRKRQDGSISILELNSDMFSDKDSYQEAVDLYMTAGYSDNREDC